ncbi:hypothetical protein GF337_02095 [candidate division KSB1 bacterium]|nr:hypothetical protein [candidate division KSB1 bacterium]
MIKARHSRIAKFLFHHYIKNLLSRHFADFQLFGKMPQLDPGLPLLLLPNHSTWWDGFFVYLLNETLIRRPIYLMMLEEQLKKYHFFSRVGAFSIEPENAKSTLRTLDYTAGILNSKTSPLPLICMFPQAELVPWGKRPLNLKRGVEWLIQKTEQEINLLPLAMKAEYLGLKLPQVFFQFGDNQIVDSRSFPGMDWLENQLETLLDDMAGKIADQERGRSLRL